MAFTEKDLEAQEQQLQNLQEELSRLNSQFDSQMKTLGLTEEELKAALEGEIPAEVEKLMAEAQDKAKREGASRAAQSTPTSASSGGRAPGAGRRGAVRL